MQIVSGKERKIKMDKKEFALNQHEKWNGKIEVISRAKIETPEDLAVAYTPGVAEPCLKIAEDVDLSYKYTRRGNLVAVVTDGTAVLGLGDIGPEAGMPVMEGKCALFKEFGDVDAFPLCIRSKDVDEIVNTVALLAGSFGGINLEDISAPRCFEIERKLKERCDIPVFHDDQHGTAVVTAAALLNALKFTGRKIEDIKVVMSGAGAAGSAIIKLLIELGLKNVIMCDRKGAIYEGREGLNEEKAKMAAITNRERQAGSLADVLKGADVFIGVSAASDSAAVSEWSAVSAAVSDSAALSVATTESAAEREEAVVPALSRFEHPVSADAQNSVAHSSIAIFFFIIKDLISY